MNEFHLALMLSALGVACCAAAVASRRDGAARRDVHLLLGSGAGLGGVALLLVSLWRNT